MSPSPSLYPSLSPFQYLSPLPSFSPSPSPFQSLSQPHPPPIPAQGPPVRCGSWWCHHCLSPPACRMLEGTAAPCPQWELTPQAAQTHGESHFPCTLQLPSMLIAPNHAFTLGNSFGGTDGTSGERKQSNESHISHFFHGDPTSPPHPTPQNPISLGALHPPLCLRFPLAVSSALTGERSSTVMSPQRRDSPRLCPISWPHGGICLLSRTEPHSNCLYTAGRGMAVRLNAWLAGGEGSSPGTEGLAQAPCLSSSLRCPIFSCGHVLGWEL